MVVYVMRRKYDFVAGRCSGNAALFNRGCDQNSGHIDSSGQDQTLSGCTMIELEYVYFSYPAANPVLKGINVRVDKGEYLGNMGGNESGKTTLVRLMAGLLLPGKGAVRVNGISTSDRSRLLEIHKRTGMVFQNPGATGSMCFHGAG